MKTKEELNALREEVETMKKKLAELSEEETEQVTGGVVPFVPPKTLDPDVGYRETDNSRSGSTVGPLHIP